MVQFCYFWRCMFCVFPRLSQCYWYRLFSLCLFLYSLPAVSFSSRFIPGWVQRFVKADLRRATLPPPQAVYTKLSPADSIWTAKTLVPFITHPGRNCFCPSQWGFGSISNYQRHCVDPQGHWQDEKRCRCEEVPFYSINMLFIGCARLSEEQEYLYPLQNITDTGWIMTYLWITALA